MDKPEIPNVETIDTTSSVIAVVLLVVLLLIGLWDIYVLLVAKEGRTVSAVLSEWGRKFPPLTIAVGMVIGHLFWPSDRS